MSRAADQPAPPRKNAPLYRLEKDEGYSVCPKFLSNLNAFPPEDTPYPMMCEEMIHPTHPEFSKPAWQELDIQSNLPLIYNVESLIWRFTRIGTTPKPFEEWSTAYQSKIASGVVKPRLRKVAVNLNGTGIETLVWYEDVVGECRAQFEKTGLGANPGGYITLLRSSGKLETIGYLGQSRTGVLLYQGRPFFVHTRPSSKYRHGNSRRPAFTEIVWYVALSTVYKNLPNPPNSYVAPARCEFISPRPEHFAPLRLR